MNQNEMKSSMTYSAVPESVGGPFVLWGSLQESMGLAAELGFDGIEIFPPGPEYFRQHDLKGLSEHFGIQIAAIGTGAGWVRHKLSLADADHSVRAQALVFLESMLDVATDLRAPMILGSMQGRSSPGVPKPLAKQYLRHGLEHLDMRARKIGGRIFYEPLNRYETNLCNTLQQGRELLTACDTDSVRLLADLFHMNIEETSIAQALLDSGSSIGHLHFVDSNRHAAGLGHIDFAPVAKALRQIGWQGFASAEAFPLPDSHSAAKHTIQTYRQLFGNQLA